MQAARLDVLLGEVWLELPPVATEDRPALPPSLRPVTWLVAPPDAAILEALTRAAGQAGIATLPARVDGRPAVALHGTSRARAMKLAYKRKLPLIVGLFEHRAEVVYTGVGSRT
jgi:hypothetical protein